MSPHEKKSLVFQELEILENFLKETPPHGIQEAANYILERVKLNLAKIKGTDEEILMLRFAAILDKVKNCLPQQTQATILAGNIRTLPFYDAQEKIRDFIKNRPDVYFHDEQTAKRLANNLNGKIPKPQNLRFIVGAIPVVLGTDENYAPYLAVMLQSLLDNSNPQRKYHFLILERGVFDETKLYLQNQVSAFPHCEIDFIEMRTVFDDIPLAATPDSHLSVDMFSRLFIPYWFDEYEKVIYLDCDMIAKADIADLYDLDIRPFCMGAVITQEDAELLKQKKYEFFMTGICEYMFLENWSRYFNSGVLVFDTKKFAQKIPASELFSFAVYFTNRYAKHLGDQSVLNILVKGEFLSLPPEWNYRWGMRTPKGKYQPSKPGDKIIHFTTGVKPWNKNRQIEDNPDAIAYRNYAETVPLYNIRNKRSKNETPLLKKIEVHLAEHCNLNCAYCTHCSPIAQQGFANIEQFERDFIKLSKLTNGNIGYIKLMGGEPLLNPDIVRYMQIARNNIPKGTIEISTNGILLPQMKEDFWRACKANDIVVRISRYPIKLDGDKIFQAARKNSVNVLYDTVQHRAHRDDVFWIQKFDVRGNRDIYESYRNCRTKTCTFLKDGKIYNCAQIPCSQYLEKHFDIKFSISNDDFLVLDNINNLQELLDFISHPSPFCRYCATTAENLFVKWKISEKEKEEWVLDLFGN